MQLTEFHRLVDETLPPAAAMSGDAIGLQVDSRRGTASTILVTLEVTDEVVDEAVSANADVILTFHPLIYGGLSRIDRDDRVGRLVADLIRHDIALLVVHTAFDAFPQGTNHVLAERLGIAVEDVLVPGDVDGHGMGVVGNLGEPMTTDQLVERITAVCGSPVRFLPGPSDSIRRVAIVGGSGMSFYEHALQSGADAFITADVKYHAFHAAQGHIGLIDPGHFEMERFVPEGLIAALQPRLGADATMLASTVNTNPVQYASPLPHEHSSLQ